MKMKTGTRVLLTIYLIVIILAFLFLLATMFGLVSPSIMQGVTSTMTDGGIGYKALYAAVAIVMIIVAFVLMFFGAGKTAPKTARIAVFENGNILITVRAIEELIEKYVREFHDVNGLNTKVGSFDSYIEIDIEISTVPEANIPELTRTLKEGLTENIQKHTGITVNKTNVKVMEIDDKMKTKARAN